jgi:hypothetical protein
MFEKILSNIGSRSIILKNPEMDTTYIQDWLKKLDASSEKKDFLKTFEVVLKDSR